MEKEGIMTVMDKFLTVEEVSKELKVSMDTIWRLIRNKKLPAYKVAGSYRIASEDLKRYLDTQRTDKPEES
jgi:excisionase family DNA binding protein